jgi:hypothetical protein
MSQAFRDVYIRQYIESQLAPAGCPGNAPARLTAQHRRICIQSIPESVQRAVETLDEKLRGTVHKWLGEK